MDEFEKKLKEQILKSTKDDSIPDLSESIKQTHLNHLKEKEEKKIPWWKNKKFFQIATPIFAAGVVCLICIPPIVNYLQPTTSLNSSSDSFIDFHPNPDKKNNNQIAFGVSSAFNFIDSQLNNSPLNILKNRLNSAPQSDFEKEIKYLNPYMYTCEQMLNNNFATEYEIVPSDIEEYTYLMHINEQIEFHYNEIGFEDDDEIEYALNGIFIVDNNQYEVRGEKEVENSSDESESELELTVYLNDDRSEYLLIEQELENETNEIEQSYLVTQVSNDTIINLVEINFEEENNEKDVEVNLIHEKTKDDDEYDASYKIRLPHNNEDYDLYSDYQMNNYEGRMSIEIVIVDANNSNYVYKDLDNPDNVVTLKRN